jgi:hypothetical protein
MIFSSKTISLDSIKRNFLLLAVMLLKTFGSAYGQESTSKIKNLRAGDILITPLLDLRDPKLKLQLEKKIDFYPPRQRIIYAESLGKILFQNSQLHRVHTSGKAFDEISSVKALNDMARKVNSATPLSPAEAEKIGSVLTGFQYLVFFSFTNEEANYQHAREIPKDADGFLVENIYITQRKMAAQIVVWDILNNQITDSIQINPTAEARSSVFVRTGKKPTAYQFPPSNYDIAREPDALDRKPTSSLETERSAHRNRFPALPEREPEFTTALKGLNPTPTSAPSTTGTNKVPARQNKFDFEDNFRMELTLKSTLMGVLPLPTLYLGAATLKWKILRIGGGIEFSPLGTMIDHEVRLYDVYNGCLCLSADVEWQLGNKNRILTGLYYGAGIFTYNQSDLLPDLDGTKSKSQSDGYIYRAPRVRYLRGAHEGLQFGIGVYQHYYDNLEKPELVANHPYQYGLELVFAAAIGG